MVKAINNLIIIIFAAFIGLTLCTANAWAKQGETKVVKFSTNMGDIVIELYSKEAPQTVGNFMNYVKSGHYEGTVFHRIVPGFVIQGGGMTADMGMKKTNPPIKNEADNGLKNDQYWLSMARTQDPNSATCQFFINLEDNEFLNHTGKNPEGWGYAVFGKVIEGMDVVDAMGKVETGTKGYYQDVPKEPIIVESVEILEQ